MNKGKKWTYMRLCVSCAGKLERAGFEVEEIWEEPTRRCRCEMGYPGNEHGGELCLYRMRKEAGRE